MRFRIGKIPVVVQPTFLVMAAVLGVWGRDLRVSVAWIAVVFVSVMLHELGHATAGLVFGLQPRIELHGMGGTTAWSTTRKLNAAQRVTISLAGPCAGFAVWGIVRSLGPGAFPRFEDGFVYNSLVEVNLKWGLLNLLPMLPLDGGSVMTHLLNAFTGGRGERPARIVSIAVAGVGLAAALLLTGGRANGAWLAMLAILFASDNWRGLQDLKAREHDAPMQEALRSARAALDERDGERVVALARPVALESRTAPVRAEALQLLAFGFLLEGRLADADAAIAALPQGFPPHPSLLELRANRAREGV
jgi:Zn-dependent protease